MKILARHKDWLCGCTITESGGDDGDGFNVHRFTATIRGWQNWKIYQGPILDDMAEMVINAVKEIRTKIDCAEYIDTPIGRAMTKESEEIFNFKGYWIK